MSNPDQNDDSMRLAQVSVELHRRLESKEKISVGQVVWPLIRPWRWYLIAGIALNAIHGLAITFQNVYVNQWLVDGILKRDELSAEAKIMAALGLAITYFLMSSIGRMAVWHCGYRIFTWVRERMVFTLRAYFFRHVNHLCLRFHGEHPSGELFNFLFGSPLGQIMAFYGHCSMGVPGAVFTIISTMCLVGSWDWAITLVLMGLAIASVLMMQFSRRQFKRIEGEYQKVEGNVAGHIADLLRGTKAVKLYAMEDSVSADFEKDLKMMSRKSYERDILGHIEYMKMEMVNYVAFFVLILVITWRFNEKALTMGQSVAILPAFVGLTGPLGILFHAYALWGNASASIERIGTVLRSASSTPDPMGTEHKVPAHGELSFENVTFRYADDTPPVFAHLTMKIPYGQRIALVGPSGAGKSTITQLLLRLYDPHEGSIRMEGVDLRRMHGNELRKRFGVVPQDPFIFRTSIRDNVRVARPDATEEQMIDALKRANAWEFVQELPQGMDTKVGEGGSSLSGGQRQRLAIARALLAAPPFYILDEATSALDTLSERLIQQTLDTELKGVTVIMIAHRLSTVKNCDRVVVLANGHVMQDGSYDSLLHQPGMFADLVAGQSLK